MKHRDKTPEHLHKKNPEAFPEYQEYYAIHEVYYDKDGGISWTKEPIETSAEDLDDLKASLQKMLEAFDKPILEYENEENPPENNESK